MKKWNLWRVSFIGFYCCVIMCTQNISAQEIKQGEKNIFARLSEHGKSYDPQFQDFEIQMNTIPRISVTYTYYRWARNVINRLILRCNYAERNYAAIIIDASNQSLWALNTQGPGELKTYELYLQDPYWAFASLKKYITSSEPKDFFNNYEKDTHFVKTYMNILALNIIKGLGVASDLEQEIDQMVQLASRNLKTMSYSKEDLNALVLSEEQKKTFIAYLKGEKIIKEVLPFFPPDYVKTEAYEAPRYPVYAVKHEASYKYGNKMIHLNIFCSDSERVMSINMTSRHGFLQNIQTIDLFKIVIRSRTSKKGMDAFIKKYSLGYDDALLDFKTKTGIDSNKFSKQQLLDWEKNIKIEKNAIKLEENQQRKEDREKRLNDKIEQFEQDLRMYYWYVYAKKLTLFILTHTYTNQRDLLTQELKKYERALNIIGEGGLLDKNQEEALVNCMFNKVKRAQLDVIFNSEKRRRTKFQQLYSLLSNKYVLSGGFVTGLLVWYMLRNYPDALPSLSTLKKFLTSPPEHSEPVLFEAKQILRY